MRTRLHSWRQTVRGPLIVIAIAVFAVGGLAFIFCGYIFGWSWAGFSTKTFWDWLQLLVVPVILAIGGFWLNQIQKSREERTVERRSRVEQEAAEKRAKAERELAEDNQREVALQDYIDKISDLLLERKLRESAEDEVRNIARVRTLTLLPRLDPQRKRTVLQFLFEAGLINTDNKPILDLSGADLSGVNLSGIFLITNDPITASVNGANLRGTNLSRANLKGAVLLGANLSDANLCEADLSGVALTEANLRRANLSRANLSGADLSRAALSDANLCGANLSGTDLSRANLHRANLRDALNITIEELEKHFALLQGATMPDGKVYL